LSKQKKFKEIVEEFLNFIDGKKLVIHNAEFDIAHLNHELKLLGKNELKNEVTDTLILARDKFPGSPISLDALCKRYRIDNSKRVQHTALIDCDLLAKVYINLIDQKEPTLDFQKVDAKSEFSKKENILYFKKVIEPTAEELKKHKEFLKRDLKKNFF
jgi:DNA polymerase-3 subunit epsilon